MAMKKNKLIALIKEMEKLGYIPGFSIYLREGREEFCLGRPLDQSFPIASVTKLFTTASILNLVDAGTLSLTDNLVDFFPEGYLKGLNSYGGRDHTGEITIDDLLYQSAGLGPKERIRLADLARLDGPSLEDRISLSKESPSLSLPGGEKSYYTGINFELLGRLIEIVEGKDLGEVFEERIFDPLDMKSTSLIREDGPGAYTYFKEKKLDLRARLSKSPASAGAVSTSKDLMVFIEAFFKGAIFDTSHLKSSSYKALINDFGPISYGRGHMMVDLAKSYALGHNGITGSMAFYLPEDGIYLTGTFGQMARQDLTSRFLQGIQDLAG